MTARETMIPESPVALRLDSNDRLRAGTRPFICGQFPRINPDAHCRIVASVTLSLCAISRTVSVCMDGRQFVTDTERLRTPFPRSVLSRVQGSHHAASTVPGSDT